MEADDRNVGLLMRAVWRNPDDPGARAACADAFVEDMGWSPDSAVSHVEYHAERSRSFRVEHGLVTNGDYDDVG